MIKNKYWLTGLIFIMLLIMAIYSGYIANKELGERSIAIQHAIDLHHSYEKGHRLDPFRCTDAQLYFSQVGIEVDCDTINTNVNTHE